jgi:hypothetical protein
MIATSGSLVGWLQDAEPWMAAAECAGEPLERFYPASGDHSHAKAGSSEDGARSSRIAAGRAIARRLAVRTPSCTACSRTRRRRNAHASEQSWRHVGVNATRTRAATDGMKGIYLHKRTPIDTSGRAQAVS